MRGVRASLVPVALTMLLAGFHAPPASAQTAVVMMFSGSATTAALGVPVFFDESDCSGNVGSPATLPPLQDDLDCGWSFSSSAVNAAAGTKTGAGAGGSINGSGGLTGWCGHSAGNGSGTATDHLGQQYDWTITGPGQHSSKGGTEGTWVSMGSLILVTGPVVKASTGQSGSFVAVANAAPTAGSCLGGTATGFTVTGAAALVV